MANPISVTELPRKKAIEDDGSGKPAHWVNAKGDSFQNPWESFRWHTFGDRLSMVVGMLRNSPSPPVKGTMRIQKPTWEEYSKVDLKHKIKSTWLGHACFFVEYPSRTGQSRGVRILYDPVFSDRCSPSQLMGPKRHSPPPCKIEDIPEVDAIVISHNHYDHLDTHTIRTLYSRARKPHIFAPLGNGAYFESLSIPKEKTHVMDWWECKRIEVSVPSDKSTDSTLTVAVDITCTPGQHFTGRSLFDTFKSLWASWVVEEVSNSDGSERPPVKTYFAGDTGYRSVKDSENENEVPVCPAFKEIGDKFGGFDFAMIPIGAYLPRAFMSTIHCAPQDSVRLFQDIRAKKALGMHWGTWILTTENTLEPPQKLKEECQKVGINEDDFNVCDIGQTLLF